MARTHTSSRNAPRSPHPVAPHRAGHGFRATARPGGCGGALPRGTQARHPRRLSIRLTVVGGERSPGRGGRDAFQPGGLRGAHRQDGQRLGALRRGDRVARARRSAPGLRSRAHPGLLLEPRLARLTVTIAPGTPPGAALSRDGVLLGTASVGAPLPVDPGEHVIVVSAPAFDSRRSVIEIRPGEHRTIEVGVGARERIPIVQPSSGIADQARAQSANHWAWSSSVG